MSSKRGRGIILQGRIREIIYNVYKAFEHEKVRANEFLRKLNVARIQGTASQSNGIEGIIISHELFEELTEFFKASMKASERVVKTTGVNKNTVTRIKREGTAAEAAGTCEISTPVKKPRGKSVVLDDKQLYALSKIITNMYMTENDVPSLPKILARAKSELNYQGSLTTLRTIMVEHLGYKYTRGTDQSKQIIIVRPDIEDDSDDDIETDYLETEIVDTDIETPDKTLDASHSLEGNGRCSDLPQT